MRSRATAVLSPAVPSIDRRAGCAAYHKTTSNLFHQMGIRECTHTARYVNNLMCPPSLYRKSDYQKEQCNGQRNADYRVCRAKCDDDQLEPTTTGRNVSRRYGAYGLWRFAQWWCNEQWRRNGQQRRKHADCIAVGSVR